MARTRLSRAHRELAAGIASPTPFVHSAPTEIRPKGFIPI